MNVKGKDLNIWPAVSSWLVVILLSLKVVWYWVKLVWVWLTKPRLSFFSGSDGVDESFTLKDLVLRGVVVLVSGAWLSILPIYVFIIYMHENNFFSYDFFTQGVFGLHTFVATTALFLFMTSVVFYGFILSTKHSITERNSKGKISWGDRFFTWVLFLVSMVTHFLIFLLSLEVGKPELMVWLMSVSFFVCMFFLCFVGNGAKRNFKNWVAPIVFIVATIYFPFMFRGETSEVVSLGMNVFRVGGGVSAEITGMNVDGGSIEGDLLLLAPNNAYINGIDGELVVVPLSERTKITINR